MPSASSSPTQDHATTPASTTSKVLNRHVRVISAEQWRGFLSWNTESGNLEPVADAIVFDPIEQKDVTVCVKFYPADGGKSRGMVNEITGWLITHALRLPQPQRAYLVKVPLKELALPLPAWLKSVRKVSTHYWAFASAKLPAESAAIRMADSDLPLLVEDVKRWSYLPSAVALDEHIANTDRHLNNLLRLGKGSYALIDNGRLAVEFGVKDWQGSDLVSTKQFSNVLSMNCFKDRPPPEVASAAMKSGSSHVDALIAVREELEDWWRRLIRDDAERAAFDAFITKRAHELSTLLSTRYGLLPI